MKKIVDFNKIYKNKLQNERISAREQYLSDLKNYEAKIIYTSSKSNNKNNEDTQDTEPNNKSESREKVLNSKSPKPSEYLKKKDLE